MYIVICTKPCHVILSADANGKDTMTDNPAYVARNLDDLPEILAEIFSQCAEGGMVFPFIAAR
jgi:hypothetical protein